MVVAVRKWKDFDVLDRLWKIRKIAEFWLRLHQVAFPKANKIAVSAGKVRLNLVLFLISLAPVLGMFRATHHTLFPGIACIVTISLRILKRSRSLEVLVC
jgi:hypothetical protein